MLFISGCNSQLADLSPIRNAPFHLETTNLSGNYTNLIIYMTKSDGTESFGKFYTSAPVIDMEVPIGNYNFYGISYVGSSVQRCSLITNKSISGLQNSVILDFQETTCAEEVFIGPQDSLNNGTAMVPAFALTSLEFCESTSGITSANDFCTDDMTNLSRKSARGHVSSYRWILKGFNKTRGVNSLSGEELVSACHNGTPLGGSLRGLSSTFMGFNVPAGDGTLSPFQVRLELWPGSTSCTQGEPFNIDLPYGLLSQTTRSKYVVDTTGTNHKLYLRANGNDVCQGLNLTPEFAGGSGNIESPKLICDERQLYNIFPSTNSYALYQSYARFNYKLLADVDLTDNALTGGSFTPPWSSCVGIGSNFMPIGSTYDGTSCGTTSISGITFDGGGKKIKGLKMISTASLIGFYREVSAGSRIQRMNLEDAVIQGAGNVGAIVGRTYNSFLTDNRVKNPLITGSAGFVGSVAGSAQGGIFEDIKVIDTIINGAGVVGGVIGQAIFSGASTVTLKRIYVSGTIQGTNQIGGIVGQYGNNGNFSSASEVRFIGTINGTSSSLGGLFGIANSARIENSYARVTINSTLNSSIVAIGGLVGSMNNRIATGPSGIYSSFIYGSASHTCSPVTANCEIGPLIGLHDGTFTDADFDTSIYPTSLHSTHTNYPVGVQQVTTSFLSLTPGWNDSGFDLMPFYPSTMWQFYNGRFPRLVDELQ